MKEASAIPEKIKLMGAENVKKSWKPKNYYLFRALYFLSLFLIIAALVTCRSAKKIQTAMSKKDTLESNTVPVTADDPKADSIRYIKFLVSKIESAKINFQTFSAKVKVNFEGFDGKNYDFNAFVRIQKDRVIWVLINAGFGIEAFRILVTPDSVKVISKLDKTYQLRSVNYLKDIAHLPVDFKVLQDLLIGNAIYLDSTDIAFYRKEENGVSLMSVGEYFRNYLTLNGVDYTIKHSKLDDQDEMRARSCDLTYSDYEKRDTFLFSTLRKISVAEKTRLDVQLGFKQYNFNETLSFPFTIPKNYKKK
jgi:Domain of unknown function (DUF4292)